ncbi:hypothetical protein K1T71_005356 [Dendrolimus kikuchii]|uniref:Uncharacterized protein n=1 Tax=Dendrolimus kikuchii TaxID=765133 RepID=A0ACC1D436_9NEOP|nr:hypothetical protein K1T71_005356 [Dendrolimus kikuchii]
MRMRREMPSTLFASPEHRALSKRIRKLVRRDLRCSNTRAIQAAIEQNRGSKVFLKPLGRSHLAKVRTADGRELTSHSEILAEVERFYGRLYSSRAERPSVQGANDPRAPLTRHYTEDIPEVDIGEIRTALGQLKNGRAPGDDAHLSRTGQHNTERGRANAGRHLQETSKEAHRPDEKRWLRGSAPGGGCCGQRAPP